jgi:hypothetical protein
MFSLKNFLVMKKKLLFPLLIIGTLFITTRAHSQANDQFAYTVTDSVQNGVKWNFLRKIDLRTGTFSNTLVRLLSRADTIPNSALPNIVAATGLDSKNKRLYYTPTLLDRLSYVDLKTLRINVVTNNFTGLMPKAADQGNVITRMVINDKGIGYALTNDANNLIRFSTRNHRVVNLGALIDARKNEISVHEICSSFGGDLIAGDDDDILYLITSRNHVFKIDIETRIALYLGTVSGIPDTFITSGAAVDFRSNRVVIGSSADKSDIYSVDFKTLRANGLRSANPWFIADLANNNHLKIKNNDHDDNDGDDDRNIFVNSNNGTGNTGNAIQLYPNPVTSNEFKIKFNTAEAGTYTINITDVFGQTVLTRAITAAGVKNNTVSVNIPEVTSRGILIVRITDKNKNIVFSDKVILQ